MLTGGFYAEIELEYDAAIAQEKSGRPFGMRSLRAIQLSKRSVLDQLVRGRGVFTTAQWKAFLIRSVGLEPEQLSERARDVILLRMVPYVERNYNMVELGPRGTGKSHLYQQISPYAHLVSGGKMTVARLFVNNANGQRGLVCQYDVVCFDEVSGVSFNQKDGVNIMKGYMESGEFSRGRESIRADGGIEQFMVTPELYSESTIGEDPLPPGQVWTISPGSVDEQAGLYRIEVNAMMVTRMCDIRVIPPTTSCTTWPGVPSIAVRFSRAT